jgi:hypothetical protein
MDTEIISLDEAKALIGERLGDTEIVPFKFGDLKVHAKDSFLIDSQGYTLSSDAQRQFADVLSVPFPYVNRSPKDLVAINYNYLAEETPDRSLNAVVRGGTISAFSDASLPHVSYNEVLDAAFSDFGSAGSLKNFSLTDSGVMTGIITSDEFCFDTEDTPYFGGVKLRFADTWAIAPMVEAYLEREWCSNGATSKIDDRKFRVKGYSRDAIIEQFSEFAGIARGQVRPMFDGFIHLRNEAVGNVREVVHHICHENKLPEKVFERVMEYWGMDGFKSTFPDPQALISKPTMYHVVNLFTYAGTHCKDLSQVHRDLLLSIGGSSAINHHERCDSCGTLV